MPDETKTCDGCRWFDFVRVSAPCPLCKRRPYFTSGLDFYEPATPVEGDKEEEDGNEKA